MSRGGRILVIDDDEAVRLRLRDVLEREQCYEIRERSDGRAGLAEAWVAPCDLVLLDLMMPGLSLGLATARTLLRACGGDLVFSDGCAATGRVSTVVLPRHLVQPAE